MAQSLGHPGGNVTGTTAQEPETTEKAFEVLKKVAPNLSRVAVLPDPTGPAFGIFQAARLEAATSLGMTLQTVAVTRPGDITAALDRVVAGNARMPVVSGGGVTDSSPRELTSVAIEHEVLTCPH